MQGSSDGRAENRSNKQESQSSSSLSVSHSSEKEESVMGGSCDTLQVPSMAQSRTMVRAASASATESPIHGALATKFKRGRFLQRQQCQEGENQEEVTATALPAASRHVSSRQTALVSSAPLLPAHIPSSSATKGGAGRPFATISPGPAAKSRSTLRPRVGPSPLL